jgi:hypothetical protein
MVPVFFRDSPLRFRVPTAMSLREDFFRIPRFSVGYEFGYAGPEDVCIGFSGIEVRMDAMGQADAMRQVRSAAETPTRGERQI